MNTRQYLKRIKYDKAPKPDLVCLKELHKRHVLTIPFENLDIHLKKTISLTTELIFDKVVLNHRGGFCYELNYLFFLLLQELGFGCKIVSSRIYGEDSLGPEFDHMSIIVSLEQDWLVDVGYGDLFLEPIKIQNNCIRKDWFKSYKINELGQGQYLLSESKTGQNFKKRYQFDISPRQIEDFQNQCHFKQYHQDSYFVKNKLCTLPSQNGRVTIMNDKLIKRKGQNRTETLISNDVMLKEILKIEFGIDI